MAMVLKEVNEPKLEWKKGPVDPLEFDDWPGWVRSIEDGPPTVDSVILVSADREGRVTLLDINWRGGYTEVQEVSMDSGSNMDPFVFEGYVSPDDIDHWYSSATFELKVTDSEGNEVSPEQMKAILAGGKKGSVQ